MDTLLQRSRAALRSSWMIALAAAGLAGCGGSGSEPAAGNPPAPTRRHGHVARQHHGCGRRLRQLFRRRAVRHFGAARRRHRRGIAGDDAHRLRPADRSLGPAGRRHSRARRHRRRQRSASTTPMPKCSSSPAAKSSARTSSARTARRSASPSSTSSSLLAITWSSLAAARRLLALDFDLAASHDVDLARIAAGRHRAPVHRRRDRARRREGAPLARRPRLDRRRGQLVHRRRSPVVPSRRRSRSSHGAHDRFDLVRDRRRARDRRQPASRRLPPSPPAR